MFIHLESVACDSGMHHNELIDRLMRLRGPWRNRDHSEKNVIVCPSCPREYSQICSFLQHIESNSCEEGYGSGRQAVWGMLRQLRRDRQWPEQSVYGRTI